MTKNLIVAAKYDKKLSCTHIYTHTRKEGDTRTSGAAAAYQSNSSLKILKRTKTKKQTNIMNLPDKHIERAGAEITIKATRVPQHEGNIEKDAEKFDPLRCTRSSQEQKVAFAKPVACDSEVTLTKIGVTQKSK